MSLKTRLDKLQAKIAPAGDSEYCTCDDPEAELPGNALVFESTEPEPLPCPRCGKYRGPLICIEYVYPLGF